MAIMGFTTNQFYCCGKLSSTSLTFIENTKQNCKKAAVVKSNLILLR